MGPTQRVSMKQYVEISTREGKESVLMCFFLSTRNTKSKISIHTHLLKPGKQMINTWIN